MSLRVSAGIIPVRFVADCIEVFLVHPGNPESAGRDEGGWSIPKGRPEPGERWEDSAIRELKEETGMVLPPEIALIPLGFIRQKGGKIVHAWGALAGDAEPDLTQALLIDSEWPPGSGQFLRHPEVDQARFFPLETALLKIKLAQAPLLRRLAAHFHHEIR